VLGSDRRLYLTLTLSLTLILPDLNLSIFPSIPCLVSGRRARSEPIIILREADKVLFKFCTRKRSWMEIFYQRVYKQKLLSVVCEAVADDD